MNLVYEPKKIIDVTKSQATFKRALNCIPAGIYGHLGPSEGCMVPVSSYPLYMDHAQGAYIYDIDGNRIIDYMCGYGPNYLGYNGIPTSTLPPPLRERRATAPRLSAISPSNLRKKFARPSIWPTGHSSQRTATTSRSLR